MTHEHDHDHDHAPIQEDGLPLILQEEPHGLVLDDKLGVIYVAHLGAIELGMRIARAISVLDVCNPATRRPRLASAIYDALPRTGSLGVTSVTPRAPDMALTTSRTSLRSRTGSSEPTRISLLSSRSAIAMRCASAGTRNRSDCPGPVCEKARTRTTSKP